MIFPLHLIFHDIFMCHMSVSELTRVDALLCEGTESYNIFVWINCGWKC